jgi:RNA polymerase sigma-70 factor (ECF subfamily)
MGDVDAVLETVMSEAACQDEEADLLARYRSGDAAALGVLVEKYRRPLFGFISNMTRDAVEAEEVFQEVWFRAIRCVLSYRQRNFGGWLMRIAHNIVIDRVRRRKGMCSIDAGGGESGNGGSMGEILASPRPGPSDCAQAGDLGRRISQAVGSLPPEQKAVFLMRAEMDLPFREISRIQGVSINTALARMHYAVGKLRTMLRDEYAAIADRGSSAGMPA